MPAPIQTAGGIITVVTETRLPPVASASTALGLRQGIISFLHPGYNEPTNVLFRMPRVDHGGRDELQFGVHHRTALAACQTVANNAFDGFLALDATGTQRVDASVPLDGILLASDYYFVISGSDRGNWVVQRAHLVPTNEQAWFARNGMSRYGVDTVVDIDDPANCIPLKSDVHICLDTWAFVLVPKIPRALSTLGSQDSRADPGPNPVPPPAEGTQQQQQQQAEYAVHILAGADPMFSRLHHDIRLPLSRLASASREFLYARFALNILMAAKAFVTAGQRRRVARFMVVEDGRGSELVEEDLDGPALFALYGAGKSRSASPPKRKRGEGIGGGSGGQQGADQEADRSSEEDEGEDDDDDDDDVWERHAREIEEDQRGRPRKRARRRSGSGEEGLGLPLPPTPMGRSEVEKKAQDSFQASLNKFSWHC
ncbi:hypothetical protein C8A00DRAFT_17191 [Chaetomidium leptoderma]|uniref:HNH nuclease domain-containing protein n=1 Tax=Chaetomidium leptoderma TaxID=669021 RepID=A0AAN6ZUH4_9PEZI|nr:hypothetical protein C8A00DRAFT_17191 [Chaetomidium leptoderma]